MAHRVPVVTGYGDLAEVGRGGFAVVYRAHHTALDRDVALKVMANANLDEASQRRFERECHAMGKLSWHPHIVPVFDAGASDEGWPYLAMAYLEKGSLADQLCREGLFDWTEAVHVGIQVAGAMQAAHDAGMLHRDLKPENVLVDPLGDCRLSDFGIAALSDQSVRTDSGQILGSVLHASPEVLGGQRATERSDVYSLASTLYELLSGSPAFRDASDQSIVAVILRATSETEADLRGHDVPDAVAELIHRSMSKSPEERPPTARAFGEELQRVQHELGVAQTPLRLPGGPGKAGGEGPRSRPDLRAPDRSDTDDRATLPPRPASPPPLVVSDLDAVESSTPGRRVHVQSQPILVVDTDPSAPEFHEHFYSEPHAASRALQSAGHAPARASRAWFWSALIASLLAVAVTTTAIVVALTR